MAPKFLTMATAMLALAGTAWAQDAIVKSADLVGAGGKAAGHVTLTAAPKGVLLRIEATGLTPGWHAVHFHEKADCSDPAFKSAGGHVHAMAAGAPVHGLLNPQATDRGDLPNIYAGPDGHATAELFSTVVSLGADGDRTDLLDADGSAVVIHAAPDDYRSQPIGGAGARVACALIR